MLQVQILMVDSRPQVFSPWMERQGNFVVRSVELIDESAGDLFRVVACHKNSDDTGNGTQDTTGSDLSHGFVDTGVHQLELTGLKAMIRFSFTFDSSVSDGGWALFRTLTPVFFNDVDA